MRRGRWRPVPRQLVDEQRPPSHASTQTHPVPRHVPRRPTPLSPIRKRALVPRTIPTSKLQFQHVPSPRVIRISDHEHLEIHAGYITYTTAATNQTSTIIYPLLRDACPCPACIDPSTRQKLHTSGQAYIVDRRFNWKVQSADFVQATTDPSTGDHGLQVVWVGDGAGTEDHVSFFSWDRIRQLVDVPARQTYRSDRAVPRVLWQNTQELAQSPDLRFSYDQVVGQSGRPSDDILLRILEQLQVYGLVVLEGVPTDPTGDKTCMLRQVAEWLGEIRNTFYGETWDVKTMVNSKNIAYTNLDLGLHMDLL